MSDSLWTPLTRRRFLHGAGSLALGAAALGPAGCGLTRAFGGDTARRIPARPDGDLVYFNYSEYIEPSLLTGFEKRYGVKVRQSYFDSMPGMLSKMRAGNRYDVIFPTSDYVARMIRANLLLDLPRHRLRHAGALYGYFDDPPYDPASRHTVPYSVYCTGICWRSDKVGGMTGSWNDLSNPAGKGKTFMLDDFEECVGEGNMLGGFNLNTTDAAQLAVSKKILLHQKQNLRGYTSNTIQALTSGNAWIQHAWNGDVVNVRGQVDDPSVFRFQKCKEGIPVGNDTMAIPVNAEHPGTALLFIDWMLRPEHAAKNVEYIGYLMPNVGATKTFAELVKDDPAIDVTVRDLKHGTQWEDLGAEGTAEWNRVWTEVRAA